MHIILILEMLKFFIFDFSIKKKEFLKQNEDSLRLFWNIHLFEMEYSQIN